MAVGVFDTRRPRVDALIGAHGFSPDMLSYWCESAYRQDALYRNARRRGVASAVPGDPPSERSPLHTGHILLLMVPESILLGRSWWLCLARPGSAFSDAEQRQAEQMLRQWLVGFCRLDEPSAGRLMISHDNKLLHADPATEQRMFDPPDKLNALLKLFRPVTSQRWPEIADTTIRDLVLDLAGTNYWIRFCRGQAFEHEQTLHWFVDLRPLDDEDELPAVHLLPDDRIAHAVAYIHDNFATSPSLTQIASAVNISPFHFHRLFSKQVDISPKHYVQRKQMQVAKWMLRSTRLQIGRIAILAGFSSHGHFTRTFHRLIGVSPSEYREES